MAHPQGFMNSRICWIYHYLDPFGGRPSPLVGAIVHRSLRNAALCGRDLCAFVLLRSDARRWAIRVDEGVELQIDVIRRRAGALLPFCPTHPGTGTVPSKLCEPCNGNPLKGNYILDKGVGFSNDHTKERWSSVRVRAPSPQDHLLVPQLLDIGNVSVSRSVELRTDAQLRWRELAAAAGRQGPPQSSNSAERALNVQSQRSLREGDQSACAIP
jgi:hypothetical protein